MSWLVDMHGRRWPCGGPTPVRYGFGLYRIDRPQTVDEDYTCLGVVDVEVSARDPEELKPGLRLWGLATLTAGGHGFGRYEAVFGMLDEDGQPDRDISAEIIDWSGETELAGAPVSR